MCFTFLSERKSNTDLFESHKYFKIRPEVDDLNIILDMMLEKFKNKNDKEFNEILNFMRYKMINDNYDTNELEKFIKEIKTKYD